MGAGIIKGKKMRCKLKGKMANGAAMLSKSDHTHSVPVGPDFTKHGCWRSRRVPAVVLCHASLWFFWLSQLPMHPHLMSMVDLSTHVAET